MVKPYHYVAFTQIPVQLGPSAPGTKESLAEVKGEV